MSAEHIVELTELVGWDLDAYRWRAAALSDGAIAQAVERAHMTLQAEQLYMQGSASPVCAARTAQALPRLQMQAARIDLQEEYRGFQWELAVVDLQQLLAFQRRLVFDPTRAVPPVPAQNDWPALTSFALAEPRSTACLVSSLAGDTAGWKITSANPDVRLVQGRDGNGGFELRLTGGTPFMEVACFRGRWFLRDGYHRACRLLRAGISYVPSVVLQTETIDQLGATGAWFFGEEVLFSPRPPRVRDFLDARLTIRYSRPALRKTIRVTIEENLEPEEGVIP